MVKVTVQGTLVLPIQRIKELLDSVKTESNKFHQARDEVKKNMKVPDFAYSVDTIEFEVSGNRVHVTCAASGEGYKNMRKQTFDLVYAVISELMTLSLKATDIENDDTLMSVKDIELISTEN